MSGMRFDIWLGKCFVDSRVCRSNIDLETHVFDSIETGYIKSLFLTKHPKALCRKVEYCNGFILTKCIKQSKNFNCNTRKPIDKLTK